MANVPRTERLELLVPGYCIGRIIGRSGETIRQIQSRSKCKVEVPRGASHPGECSQAVALLYQFEILWVIRYEMTYLSGDSNGRVAPAWYHWRTLYRLSYSAPALFNILLNWMFRLRLMLSSLSDSSKLPWIPAGGLGAKWLIREMKTLQRSKWANKKTWVGSILSRCLHNIFIVKSLLKWTCDHLAVAD